MRTEPLEFPSLSQTASVRYLLATHFKAGDPGFHIAVFSPFLDVIIAMARAVSQLPCPIGPQ